MDLFDKTFSAIEKKLDLHLKRHAVLSSNVANADTPNYIAREVDFAGELKRALGTAEEPLAKTDARHIDVSGSQQAHVVLDHSGAVGADGNNVDLDLAMGKLASNARKYNHAANLLSMKLMIIRMAARGRGGF